MWEESRDGWVFIVGDKYILFGGSLDVGFLFGVYKGSVSVCGYFFLFREDLFLERVLVGFYVKKIVFMGYGVDSLGF